jgi:hypothetical protein
MAGRRVRTSQLGQLLRACTTLTLATVPAGKDVAVTEPVDIGDATVLAVVAVLVAAEAPPAASASVLAKLRDSTEPRKANVVLFI